jgi:hypothetical protein
MSGILCSCEIILDTPEIRGVRQRKVPNVPHANEFTVVYSFLIIKLPGLQLDAQAALDYILEDPILSTKPVVIPASIYFHVMELNVVVTPDSFWTVYGRRSRY